MVEPPEVEDQGEGDIAMSEEVEVQDRNGERRMVWTAYRIAGQPSTGGLSAKVWQLYGLLRGRRDAQALVLTAPCAGDCEAARAALTTFARSAVDLYFEETERIVSSAGRGDALAPAG